MMNFPNKLLDFLKDGYSIGTHTERFNRAIPEHKVTVLQVAINTSRSEFKVGRPTNRKTDEALSVA